MNQTQNESQALKEKLSEEEVARQHKQREISEMLKLQQAKSLCKSLALSNFYETEIEIWAGFGPIGNTVVFLMKHVPAFNLTDGIFNWCICSTK